MSEFISWELVATLVTIFGVIETIRRHQAGKIEKIRDDAALAILKVDADLQTYKLRVAETYASQANVGKQFEQVAHSITEIGERMESRFDGMNQRLDRVIEGNNNSKPTTRRGA